MFNEKIIFFVFLLFSCTYSFGYSGAGGECGHPDIERAAMFGNPDKLESEITKEIYRIELLIDQRKFSVKPPRWMSGKTIEEKRSIFIKDWRGCYATILDFPAAVGNLDNINYLLSRGADPTGIDNNGDSIFMRCRSLSTDGASLSFGMPGGHISEVMKDRKIMAYKMLIQNGGDVNFSAPRGGIYGDTALNKCRDFSLIELYFYAGGNPNSDIYRMESHEGDINPLIRYYLIRLFTSSDLDVENNLKIFKFLYPKISNKRMTKSDRWRVCMECVRSAEAGGSRKKVCNKLEEILDPSIKLIYSNTDGKESDNDVCKRELFKK